MKYFPQPIIQPNSYGALSLCLKYDLRASLAAMVAHSGFVTYLVRRFVGLARSQLVGSLSIGRCRPGATVAALGALASGGRCVSPVAGPATRRWLCARAWLIT
jgi:hypothetical protein